MNKNNAMLSQKITNTKLREDNQVLRKNLRHLVQATKRNLDIQQKMDEIGESIIRCSDLDSLVINVTDAIIDEFGLTVVTMSMVERYRPLLKYQNSEIRKKKIADRLIFMEEEALLAVFPSDLSPVLQGCIEHGSVDFFGMRYYRRIRSQAFTPLIYGGELLGSLNLGSNERLRYREHDGVDFLKRLSQTLSLSLANMELKISDVING